MSVWALATEVAIWTLVAGSLAVFGWFLVEVVRLARTERDEPVAGSGDAADPDTADAADGPERGR